MEELWQRGRKPQIFVLHVMVHKVTIVTGEHQNVDPPSRPLLPPPPSTPAAGDPPPLLATESRKDLPSSVAASPDKSTGERPRYSVGIRTPSPRTSRATITRRTALRPLSVYSESVSKDGGKKRKKKGEKSKKKGKKVGPVVPMTPVEVEPPPPPPEPHYRLLPPLSIGLRLFDGETVYVEQVQLPATPPTWEPPPPPPPEEPAQVPITPSFALPRKSKGRKSKKGKKGKGDKKGKKGRKKSPSTIVPPPVPVRPPTPPPPYTSEELRWKLEDERWVGKGLVAVRAGSADELAGWLQRGWTLLEVCRWRGHGPRERIATARLCLPSAMAEAAIRATRKTAKLPIQVKCEGRAKIRDMENQEIGFMEISMTLTCHGDSWASGVPLSHSGLQKVLQSCPAEKSRVEEKRREELECLYDVANLIHYLDRQKEHSNRPNLSITFEDIMCAMC